MLLTSYARGYRRAPATLHWPSTGTHRSDQSPCPAQFLGLASPISGQATKIAMTDEERAYKS